jgi:hypothetical protein
MSGHDCGVDLRTMIKEIWTLGRLVYRSSLPLVPEEIYTPETLSQVLGVAIGTLARWRKTGTGPPCSKLPNGEIRYLGRDVMEWLEKRKLNGLEEESTRLN